MLELNKAYCMDCMQGMAEFPDGFFDLAVVDPPYGDAGGRNVSRVLSHSFRRALPEVHRGGYLEPEADGLPELTQTKKSSAGITRLSRNIFKN